jgi:hypothetical protein
VPAFRVFRLFRGLFNGRFMAGRALDSPAECWLRGNARSRMCESPNTAARLHFLSATGSFAEGRTPHCSKLLVLLQSRVEGMSLMRSLTFLSAAAVLMERRRFREWLAMIATQFETDEK